MRLERVWWEQMKMQKDRQRHGERESDLRMNPRYTQDLQQQERKERMED